VEKHVVVGVDGDFRVRESIVRLAESAGYAPLVFPSAEALLQSGALREAACLITDVRMPGMDGLELLRRVSAELMPRGPWWNGMGNLARGARSEHDEESHARQAMVVVFLGAIVPSQSLTSVAAMKCLVASAPEKGQARPRRRDCEVIANRAEPGKIQKL
jgi:CheY-like chemotaxis protein